MKNCSSVLMKGWILDTPFKNWACVYLKRAPLGIPRCRSRAEIFFDVLRLYSGVDGGREGDEFTSCEVGALAGWWPGPW